ncbi:MAG: hypothetical protein M3010_06575, partial [Candidatus Dormibacteraeota bacterium]|nr:hypothetical protein [Candidatus Dormibacteraeota bacterium]
VHGTTGVVTDAITHAVSAAAPTVTVDIPRRQVDVRVPEAAWAPSGTVLLTAGVGVWDASTGNYAQPGPVAGPTQPGGCLLPCPALFNVAFRTAEPVPVISAGIPTTSGTGFANTIVEGGVGVKLDGTWWRERRQADVLKTGDVTPFTASVDFNRLASRASDESMVPRTGHFDRIMASHFNLGQGVDYAVQCFPNNPPECTGRYLGQLQPYAVYVPDKPIPTAGFGLVLSMHGLSANYNEFLGSHEAEQLGNRGTGSIIASPEGRGPDGFYHNYAEADVFEMWADVARQYRLNPNLTDVSGYSMGGEGTYLLASRWPDLFGRAFPIVGPPTTAGSFRSLRNIPVMAWYGQTDELVGPEMSEQAFLNARAAGLRYDHWIFTPAGHVTLGNNDEFTPGAAFLGDQPVDRNPPHVTYYRDPGLDTRALSKPDHAYWVSGITLGPGGTGTVEAVSQGFGVGDAPVLPLRLGAGVLMGGSHPGGLPYQERILDWGPTPSKPVADRLDVTVSNVSALTVDVARARVDCKVDLHVLTDVTTTVRFTSCARTVTVTANYGPNAPGLGLPRTSVATPVAPATVLIVILLGVLGLAGRRGRRLSRSG